MAYTNAVIAPILCLFILQQNYPGYSWCLFILFWAIYVKIKKIKKIKNNMKFSLQLVIFEFLRLHVRVEFV